jgi:hypothetical protein
MFRLGKLLALFFAGKYDILFFIPHMNTGGAERVHLTTLKALNEEEYKTAVIVTATPEDSLKKEFKSMANVFDIRLGNSNRWAFFFFLGFWSTYINRTKPKLLSEATPIFFIG